MVVHGVGAADADHQRLFDLAAQGQFDIGQTPSDRQRRTREDREAEPVAVVDHFSRFVKAVGEVLVVVDGRGAAVFFKDFDAFFEKLIARVQNLSFVVSGVLAVLADDQHCIASQFVAAAAQGFGDSGVHGKVEFARPVLALVAFGLLIDVERDDFAVGAVPAAAVGIADYESGRQSAGRARGSDRW